MSIRGTLRKMCTEKCSKKRINYMKRDMYRERYGKLREAGASRAMARWGSSSGEVRFRAALDVLLEERKVAE